MAIEAAVTKTVPPRGRGRLNRLLKEVDDPEMVRSALFDAYLRAGVDVGDSTYALRQGLASRTLEELEKAIRAGLPSRNSTVRVDAMDPHAEEFAELEAPTEHPPNLHEIAGDMDPRTLEILESIHVGGETEAEIASRFGISQQRVNAIKRKAITDL
jgi:DNA-binding NarL/FixJ family response regulator